ncbi:MAG: hypothetical protein ACRDT6_17245 [Micromonosporaceae bacterium]
MRTKRLWTGGGWEDEHIARTPTGTALTMGSAASPAIAQVYAPGRATRELYGAFADATNRLRFYRYDVGTGDWVPAPVLESNPMITGRPSMAWVPNSTGAEYPGRLYLAYQSPDRVIRWMMSYTRVTENPDGTVTKAPLIGVAGPFDNVWGTGYGIELFFEPGRDTNLRALLTWSSDKPERDGKLTFRPKADGIQDVRYVNYDDWQVLRVNLCRNVVNPGGLVSNPVSCPSADW